MKQKESSSLIFIKSFHTSNYNNEALDQVFFFLI